MVRYDYIARFGYYCSESSEHNSEYNCFYLSRTAYPELIDRFNIPLDEYPRRCVRADCRAGNERKMTSLGRRQCSFSSTTASDEYASLHYGGDCHRARRIKIGGNVLNTGHLDHKPAGGCLRRGAVPHQTATACIPAMWDRLPVQLAAMNMTNINPQLMTIEAAVTRKRESITRPLC